jgi:hypothetical protein
VPCWGAGFRQKRLRAAWRQSLLPVPATHQKPLAAARLPLGPWLTSRQAQQLAAVGWCDWVQSKACATFIRQCITLPTILPFHCLQQCDIKAWQQLAGLAAVAPIADWPAVNLRRLYQAYMHVRAAHGQAVQLPAQFLRAASAAFQAISTQGTTSAFHRRVARELEAACPGEAVEVDQRVGPGGRSARLPRIAGRRAGFRSTWQCLLSGVCTAIGGDADSGVCCCHLCCNKSATCPVQASGAG